MGMQSGPRSLTQSGFQVLSCCGQAGNVTASGTEAVESVPFRPMWPLV